MVIRTTPTIRGFAERLLAREAAAAETSVPVVFFVCEKLRRPLTTLAGSAGFHSILSRALTLAQREVPSLANVRVNADGSLEQSDSPLQWAPRKAGPGGVDAEGVVLLAHLLGLLFTFIGQALTARLIHDIWPKEFLIDFEGDREA